MSADEAVAALLGPLTHADGYAEVYEARCPACGTRLSWAYETPPIPRTFFTWFTEDGDRRLSFCPGCEEPLPEGDLRAAAWRAARAAHAREPAVRHGRLRLPR